MSDGIADAERVDDAESYLCLRDPWHHRYHDHRDR